LATKLPTTKAWSGRGGGTRLAIPGLMIIKALASYGLAKLLGFGIVGAVVIYVLLTALGK